ncbi:hypothetical protein PRK78_007414 [Emydomyces testavorans]|uniref:DUF7918 domain-containing protein n=1 Tax=Emydomyces testavorans TaxID=2070801 RepID=A0AAF0DN68_9EURO|nr:hypothetical protein PRK78_007414 [Emydomyces testavorans]
MAILDGVEVQVKLSSVNLPLRESAILFDIHHSDDPVPWASDPTRSEKFVSAPSGQLFSVCIRLKPSFDFSVGDGLHITLKIDEGTAVNHYYSTKFTEMEKDQDGWFTKTIDNAIIGGSTGYRRILFSFANLSPELQAHPFGYVDKEAYYPEGKISVTVIRVSHVRMVPRLATVTYPDVATPSLGIPGSAAHRSRAVEAAYGTGTSVTSQPDK